MFEVRHRLGQELAKQYPVDADIVISVLIQVPPLQLGILQNLKYHMLRVLLRIDISEELLFSQSRKPER